MCYFCHIKINWFRHINRKNTTYLQTVILKIFSLFYIDQNTDRPKNDIENTSILFLKHKNIFYY